MFKRRNRAWVAALLAGALAAGLTTQASAMPEMLVPPVLGSNHGVLGSNSGATQTPVAPDRPTGLTAELGDGGGGGAASLGCPGRDRGLMAGVAQVPSRGDSPHGDRHG